MKKKQNESVLILLFAVATFFIGIGAFFLANNQKYANGIETDAVITDIYERYTASDEEYEVWVKFTDLNNTERKGKLNFYSSTMREGKTVKIKYKKDSPNDFIYAGGITNVIYVCLFAFGILSAGIGAYCSVTFYKTSEFRLNKIKKNGEKVQAVIQSFTIKRNFSVNDKKPAVVCCQNRQDTARVYKFRAFVETERFNKGDEITVYVSKTNPKKYVVDVGEYLERKGKTFEVTNETITNDLNNANGSNNENNPNDPFSSYNSYRK